MSTPDTEKPRKRRMKATTDLGRQLMQKERKRLAEEQALLGEKLANEAKALREAKFNRKPGDIAPKQQIGMNRSVVRRTAAVLSSENVVVPIHVKQGDEYSQNTGWTDFNQIQVTYRPHDNVRLLAAELRGLLYHEGGHCRWSDPFLDLAEEVREILGTIPTAPGVTEYRAMHRAWNCLEDQRMETAVVSDAPRKAAFFTPWVMSLHLQSLDHMAANYPLLVWRRYLPAKLLRQARLMFVTLHGAKGEYFAKELDRVVTSYVTATDYVTMWTAVCEFHILLQAMKPLASNMDDAGHSHQTKRDKDDDFEGLSIPIDPSMLSQGDEDDEDEGDEPEAWGTIETEDEFEHFLAILWALLNGGDVFQVRYVNPSTSSDESEGAGSPGDLSEEPEQDSSDEAEQGSDDESGTDDEDGTQPDESDGTDRPTRQEKSGDDDSAEDEVDDNEGDEADGDDDQDESSDIEHGGKSGSHTDEGDDAEDGEPFTQDDLDAMLQEAEDERLNQSDLDGDVEAYSDAIDRSVSDLDNYTGGISTNRELITEAEVLAQQIEEAFHAHTMDRQPAWVEQQRRGVLNVGRYLTRQPGDTEFFRAWTEDEQPGFDIAVTVMLDYSYSMSSYNERLAQCGFACKLACDKLEIPCTVVLWDTDARTLWDARERAELMPTISATGGTDPSVALADLDNHRMDRSKHIVLIMTDGQWQGGWSKRSLAYYKDDGRQMIGFGYGSDHLAKIMEGYGCDEAFAIRDLMEIPHRLEEALLEIV